MPLSSIRFEGWPIVGVLTVVLIAMTIALLAMAGVEVDGIRLVIRATARTSVVLFGAAFTASSLATLWPHRLTKWGLRNRRFLGVGFGVSHTIHYFAVLAFLLVAPEQFELENGTLGPDKLVPIVLLVLMVGTSFDRAVSILGRRQWKALHWVGGHVFWAVFLLSFAGRAKESLFYAGFSAFVIAMILVRLAAFGRGVLVRRRRSA